MKKISDTSIKFDKIEQDKRFLKDEKNRMNKTINLMCYPYLCKIAVLLVVITFSIIL